MSIDVSTKEGRAELRRHVENFGRFCNDGSWWSPQVLALLDLVDALGGNADVERKPSPDGSTIYAHGVIRRTSRGGAHVPGWGSVSLAAVREARDAFNAFLLDTTPDPGADG